LVYSVFASTGGNGDHAIQAIQFVHTLN